MDFRDRMIRRSSRPPTAAAAAERRLAAVRSICRDLIDVGLKMGDVFIAEEEEEEEVASWGRRLPAKYRVKRGRKS